MTALFDYRTWQHQRVMLHGKAFAVATKPGVFGHGHSDPAAEMLATSLRDLDGATVAGFACGNGVVGLAAAAAGATRVALTDRYATAVEAARRTMTLNAEAVQQASVSIELGHGARALPAGLVADVVTVRVVPEKLALQVLLHDALRVLRPGGRLLLAGGNHEGVKPAARLLEAWCGAVRVEAQREGHRLVSAIRPADVSAIPTSISADDVPFLDAEHFQSLAVNEHGVSLTICTRPGVFSWAHLDEASADLLRVLSEEPLLQANARVLDIGCGAGVLGAYCAARASTNSVTLVDVDSEAVRCASATLHASGLTNARALVSDVAEAVFDEARGTAFDVVVTNPPFHVGKHTVLDVPRQFIVDAHRVLRRGGRLLLVANRTLPYEAVVAEHFGHVETRFDGRRFKVLSVTKA